MPHMEDRIRIRRFKLQPATRCRDGLRVWQLVEQPKQHVPGRALAPAKQA